MRKEHEDFMGGEPGGYRRSAQFTVNQDGVRIPLYESFLPAEQLGLSETERGALIQTLRMFESNKIPHVHVPLMGSIPEGGDAFNMCRFVSPTKCGTVRCIGGWANYFGAQFYPATQVFAEGDYLKARRWPRALQELFYISSMHRDLDHYNFMDAVTVKQAAAATRNFLTTGDANWRAVLAVES